MKTIAIWQYNYQFSIRNGIRKTKTRKDYLSISQAENVVKLCFMANDFALSQKLPDSIGCKNSSDVYEGPYKP